MSLFRICACWLAAAAFLVSAAPGWAQLEEVTRLVPVVFFPPTPPVYGAPIAEKPANAVRMYGGRPMIAPDVLAEFAGETFYPALSTRLFATDLSRNLQSQLESYQAKRRTQTNALLDLLVTLHHATTGERAAQLRAFAAAQSPHLATLEAEAEELRCNLISDLIWNRIDWNAGRRWRLGATDARKDWAEKEAEFQVIRAAAYYEKGFTSAQRGLLRELAMELQPLARKSRGAPITRADSDAMFFSPETSRWRLPADLPPSLRQKIGAYNSQKAELKRELREAVVEQDQAAPAKRAQAFAALADRQWPRFSTLELLAEEIRVELAVAPEPSPPPAPPWLPQGLLANIRSYNQDRDEYYEELKYKIDRELAKIPRPDLWAPADERVRQQAEYAAAQNRAKAQAIQDFQSENAARFKSLEERYRGIREMLTVIAQKQTDRKTGRPMNADTLLEQYVASMKQFDHFGRETTIYSGYRMAMLQPGLSPEQRRLLFAHVLVSLAQPLPNGEVMPRKAGAHPVPSW